MNSKSGTLKISLERKVDRKTLLQFLSSHINCGDIPDNAAISVQTPISHVDEVLVTISWTEVTDDQI